MYHLSFTVSTSPDTLSTYVDWSIRQVLPGLDGHITSVVVKQRRSELLTNEEGLSRIQTEANRCLRAFRESAGLAPAF